MDITLIDFTGVGTSFPEKFAAATLIFAKSTRLEMDPSLFSHIYNEWTNDQIECELEYIANTIPSSWEFVNYTFLIKGVTRAFTHQLVRTRTASFAQQTMRVLNVHGWAYGVGPTIIDNEYRNKVYSETMERIADSYNYLIEHGAAVEDARGVLPTNIHTNILMSANLRTIVEMVAKRSSPRTQGEYRDFIELLKARIAYVHPWTEKFFRRTNAVVASDLDREISSINDEDKRRRMTKLVDQIRGD